MELHKERQVTPEKLEFQYSLHTQGEGGHSLDMKGFAGERERETMRDIR